MKPMKWHIPKKPSDRTSYQGMIRSTSSGYRKIPATVGFNDFPTDGGDGGDESAYPPAEHAPTDRDVSQPIDRAERIGLIGRIAPGWRLLKPLLLRVERDEDGGFVVSDEVFAVHGDAHTREGAVKDYIASLIEYYDLLSERVKGDEPTGSLFRHLSGYLERTGT